PQLPGLDRSAERHFEPHALFAHRRHELREPVAESAVHHGQRAAAHAVAHGHLHEPGRGRGADQHVAAGAAQGPERARHLLEQLLHGAGAVADHRPLHGGEDVGVDVGRARKEESAERRRWRRGGGAHAGECASCSTSPPTTTSLVFTMRTPSSPHSLRRCSPRSRSIGFIASVTANSRVCGRCSSRPSIAALSQTSRATPYSTTSCGSSTSGAGRRLSLVKRSKRGLWKRMSPWWRRSRSTRVFVFCGSGSSTSGSREAVSGSVCLRTV